MWSLNQGHVQHLVDKHANLYTCTYKCIKYSTLHAYCAMYIGWSTLTYINANDGLTIQRMCISVHSIKHTKALESFIHDAPLGV